MDMLSRGLSDKWSRERVGLLSRELMDMLSRERLDMLCCEHIDNLNRALIDRLSREHNKLGRELSSACGTASCSCEGQPRAQRRACTESCGPPGKMKTNSESSTSRSAVSSTKELQD